MNKIVLLLTGFLFSHFMNAQKGYVYFGKNQTEYVYKTTTGQSQPNLKNDSGDYYEIGYEHDISKSWMYMGGLSLNQYNNVGGDELNYYSWKTRYLGLQNAIGYSFYNKNNFKALLTAGVGVSKLLSGTQQINNSFYDLKYQDNFNEVFIQPSLGLEMRYNLLDVAELSLKYNFSKSWNVSDRSEGEKLSFNNHQLALGIHIPLNQTKKSFGGKEQKDKEESNIFEDSRTSKSDVIKSEAPKSEVVKQAVVKSEIPKSEVHDKSSYIKELINGGYVTAYFDVAKTQPTNVEGIDFVLTYLRSNPNSTVTIYGSSDETGSTKYNEQLSLARAKAVKRILETAGIQENRIVVVSKGEDTSVDSKSPDTKRLARRVTFKVD